MKSNRSRLRLSAWMAALILIVTALGLPAAQAEFTPGMGDNLLPDSARERTGDGFVSIDVSAALAPYAGQRVRVSFDLMGFAGQSIRVYPYQDSGVSIAPLDGGSVFVTPEEDGAFARYSFLATVRDFGRKTLEDGRLLSAGTLAFYDTAEEKRPFTVRLVKIELGDAATPWSPAPGDAIFGQNLLPGGAKPLTASRGFAQEMVRDALADYIGWPVTVSFDVYSEAGGRLRVYPYQDSGVSIADSAVFDVTGGAFARFSLTTAVRDYGQKTQESGAPLSAGSIGFHSTDEGMERFIIRNVKIELGGSATAFSFAPGDEMAGVNLVVDGGREQASRNGFFQIPTAEILKKQEGAQITISFEIKGDPSSVIRLYAYQASGLSIAAPDGGDIRFSPTRRFRPCAFTVNVKDYGQQYSAEGAAYSAGSIALYSQAEGHADFTLRNIKIEFGGQATAWSPAPGDPALVFSAEDALGYIKACAGKQLESFMLYPDGAVLEALTENKSFALRRLLIQAGYSLNAVTEVREDGSIAVTHARPGVPDCVEANTADDLIAFFRQAADRKLTAFNAVLSRELFDALRADGWSALFEAERSGGVVSRTFSFYDDCAVLCYSNFRGGAPAP